MDLEHDVQNVLALINEGRVEEADHACTCLLANAPGAAIGWILNGVIRRKRADLSGAIEDFRHALLLEAENADAYYQLGLTAREAGLLEQAFEALTAALRLRPGNTDLMLALAETARDSGNFADAESLLIELLKRHTDFPPALYEFARLRATQGEGSSELALLDRLLAVDPDHLKGRLTRAERHDAAGHLDEAVQDYEYVLARHPEIPHAHNNLGSLYLRLGRIEDGLKGFQQAIDLGLREPQILKNLGITLFVQNRNEQAISALREYLASQPDDVLAHCSALFAELKLCRWQHLEGIHDRVMLPALAWNGEGIPPPPFMLHLIPMDSTEAEHLRIAKFFAGYVRQKIHVNRFDGQWRRRNAGERIRLGYVSADFRYHPVAQLMLGMFKRHDRRRFEVIAYSLHPDDGSIYRRRVEAEVDRFVDLQPLDASQAAQRIFDDGIDILIDLTGYTTGCRPEIMAQRPAPVQVQYLGYPGTMGADFIDYLITDKVVTPPESQAYYTERFVYLPNGYQINDQEQPIGPTPSRAEAGLPEHGFVFCCLCMLYKYEPRIFALWMRLLRQVPDSVLWLASGPEEAQANLVAAAEAHGVAADRLIFAPRLMDKADHLARHRLADLFLDTFYYNGHTTVSDALWAGLPVLTCPGGTFARRVGASLLTTLGLNELIARDLDDYELIALRLARDPDCLAGIRAKLASARECSPLFDSAAFVRDFECALEQIALPEVSNARIEDQALEVYQQGDNASALALVEQALGTMPHRYDLWNFKGVLLKALHRISEAQLAYRRAILMAPEFADTHNNLANCLRNEGELEQAVSCYRRAIELQPGALSFQVALGGTLRDLGRLDEAMAILQQVITVQPDNADAHWDYGLALLAAGRYREGFSEYEWRWKRNQPIPPNFRQPVWDGSQIMDKTVFIYTEQGMGDFIQYLRFLPWVLARAGHVIMDVFPALQAVIPTHPRLQVVARGGPIPDFDCHCALMSLPYFQGLDFDAVGMPGPYLNIPEDRRQEWQKRLGESTRPRIGVLWAGNPTHQNDRNRSPHFNRLLPVILREDMDVYLLQVGDGRRDLAGLTLPPHVTDLGPEITDFADTAAIVSLLDLVITPDTSTAHLAGALGRPVWVMLPEPPDWRWLLERTDSPWYPSARLFRQPVFGDWATVVATIMRALDEWLIGQGSATSPGHNLLSRQRTAELLNDQAAAAFATGHHATALSHLCEAVEWGPAWPVAHYNLALLLLQHGDYLNGFKEFEWRLQLPQIGPHPLNRPCWEGEDLSGKTILLHWEQGFGDSLQFLRFGALVAARGARVVLEIQPALKALSLGLPWASEVVTTGEIYPAGIDCKCPILSLPFRLGITEQTLPSSVPYLSAPADRLQRWIERLGPRHKPRIGMVWAGSPTNATENVRAPGFEAMRQLWQISEVEFVIIQKGAGRSALDGIELPGNVIDVGEALEDFADTAAVMSQLDAMISSDTSTAHLAGALGIPLWVPLHYTADWRWEERDGRCLWYPTARLFRQSAPCFWDDVVAALVQHLRDWLENKQGNQ